jgi:hypothetical protein
MVDIMIKSTTKITMGFSICDINTGELVYSPMVQIKDNDIKKCKNKAIKLVSDMAKISGLDNTFVDSFEIFVDDVSMAYGHQCSDCDDVWFDYCEL